MKNNTFFKLFIIILIGLAFRLWFLDKPEGLWNDEYVSWFIASQTDLNTFWQKVYGNCHMPLYYFYLKIWMFCFSDTDISLRWSSVLPSILSIPMMYLVGKELKDKNLGLLCALMTSLSSFLIYFAQEARLYSLIFLLSSISVFYFIKAIKDTTNKNIALFFISNALIITTHTLGIIYSFFNILFFLFHIIKENNKEKAKLIKPIIFTSILVLFCSSLLWTIAASKNLSQFWSNFSFSKIGATFIDYFSPVLTNLVSTPASINSYVFSENDIVYSFIIFAAVPTILGLIGFIRGTLSAKWIERIFFNKETILKSLLYTAFLFFLVLIILSALGKMILITKYSIEMYPILILTTAYGFLSFKKDFLKKSIIIAFVGLNLFYLYFSPDAAQRRPRPEGHKAVAELIKESNFTKNDIIIFTYYSADKFERYLPNLENYTFYSITKFDFNYPLFDGENYFEVLKNGKEKHNQFFTEFPNQKFQEYIKNNYLNNLQKGQKIGIITLDSVSFIPTTSMEMIINNQEAYKNTSFIFLIFSAVKNNLLHGFKTNLKFESLTKVGDWSLHIYVKE